MELKPAKYGNKYLLVFIDTFFCSTGLAPCVSTTIFNQSRDFCVMIRLVPRIYYHPEEAVIEAYESKHQCEKREPVSLTLAVMQGLGLAAGIGTGTTALIKGPADLQHKLFFKRP